jgi:predicted acylesterase/phospholipase RssA
MCPVSSAILMSMCVPFIWPEVQWQRGWGNYLDQDITGHAIVDGGVLANLPIRYMVDQHDEDVQRVMGPPAKTPNKCVALLLNGGLPIPGDVPHDEGLKLKLFERMNRLMDTMSAWQYSSIGRFEEYICHIPCMGHPPMEMSPTPAAIDRLQALINSGRCAMTEHAKKRKL